MFNAKKSSYQRIYKDKRTTMRDIMNITNTKLSVIQYLMEINIINSNYHCPSCDDLMMFCENMSAHKSSDNFVWRCKRTIDGKRHQIDRSIRKGSWIHDCNLTLEEIVKMTYCWSQDYTQQQVIILYLIPLNKLYYLRYSSYTNSTSIV